MKKCKIKYNVGGSLNGNGQQQTGQTVGNLAGIALSLALPGVGSLLAPVLGQVGSMIDKKAMQTKLLQDHFNSMSNSTNPYGNYKNGGEISGYEGLLKYDGDSHEAPSGGIDVTSTGLPSPSSNQQVEGGETVRRVGKKAYVFSDTLKL